MRKKHPPEWTNWSEANDQDMGGKNAFGMLRQIWEPLKAKHSQWTTGDILGR